MSSTTAANVRAELARRRIPMIELANAIGMGRESMRRRLHDHTDFTVGELTAVANYLGVPACDLLGTTNGQPAAS